MTARILIVEDNTALADNLLEVLSGEGWETHTVTTAEEALNELERETYSAVLTDLRLPGQSGLRLIEEMRSRGNATPVLLMTAFAQAKEARAAEQAGALAVLFKPLDLMSLVGLVRECFSDVRTVLILEDNRLYAENLAEALTSRGFCPIVTHSLDEALSQRRLPRVALVDFRLPDGNGLDAAHQLKAKNPAIKIFLLSGYVEEAQTWMARAEKRLPISASFDKTVALENVVNAVSSLVEEPKET